MYSIVGIFCQNLMSPIPTKPMVVELQLNWHSELGELQNSEFDINPGHFEHFITKPFLTPTPCSYQLHRKLRIRH